jgi:hypothetical protein
MASPPDSPPSNPPPARTAPPAVADRPPGPRPDDPLDTRLFTVRVTRHAGRWRAAVRAVGEEHTALFTEPAPLAAWLLPGAGTAPTPASPAPTPTSSRQPA